MEQVAFGKHHRANRKTDGVLQRFFADHDFGTATTNVDNECDALVSRQVRQSARICKSTFFGARDDERASSEYCFGLIQKHCCVSCATTCFGSSDANGSHFMLLDERCIVLQPSNGSCNGVFVQRVVMHNATT